MFPIRDHNPSGRRPYVTYALVAANILIFLSYADLIGNGRAIWQFYAQWAIIPARITQGAELHTLFSSMFLHAGVMHLGGNMLFLWIFGDNLEDEMGHLPFLGFYLTCGVGSGLVHVVAGPLSPVPTVGASGAIAGVMGAYLLLYPKARVDVFFFFIVFFKIIPMRAWVMLGAWFALQVFNSVGSDSEAGGVAYWAHSGGFVIGLLLALPLWVRRGGPRFWSQTEGHPPHPEADYTFVKSSIPRVPRR
ncbi:rhomboid family intramembrane serine protease [Arenibacterium halophilum]|uniref:Rhomboid family intramembrane serine protease n=1 Tax=Arenibacterium halophilum TaxID=2583821 RepID=A0ABY2XEJ6_9RHOB|nr:rhomboid family intramembrane serine protease [Arenibacterium halophilum]TMV15078.1 rhomboid family intramembrane serine protease [Arenibacterium halophilum]